MPRSCPWIKKRKQLIVIGLREVFLFFQVHLMRQLITTAFNHPVNFPHISQVVYPGDRVVIAADAFVVGRPALLADIVSEIISVGLNPNDVSILMLESEQKMLEQPFREALPEEYRTSINVVAHHPTDPQSLAMLGVAKDDSPILLHRALVDADVIIPIERFDATRGAGHWGMQSVIYPRFTDAETQKRFLFSETKKNHEKNRAALVAEIDEIAWSLGVVMTVQILTDDRDEVTQVIVGDAKEIAVLLAKDRKTRKNKP